MWIAINNKTGEKYSVPDKAAFEATGTDHLFTWQEVKTPPEIVGQVTETSQESNQQLEN